MRSPLLTRAAFGAEPCVNADRPDRRYKCFCWRCDPAECFCDDPQPDAIDECARCRRPFLRGESYEGAKQ